MPLCGQSSTRFVTSPGVIEEHRLNARLHDRAAFDCGVAPLNEYLRRFALQDEKRNLCRSYVLVNTDAPERILGYYTLSSAQVEATDLTEDNRRRLPRYPVPCIRIGRLAVARESQGAGIGRRLLGLAITRCLAVRDQLGVFAVIVDAKDDAAIEFYRRYGFRQFTSKPDSLYLPIEIAKG